jgi:hypothetical protein
MNFLKAQAVTALSSPRGFPDFQVNAMTYYSAPAHTQACRDFALECNRQLFEEAQLLNQAAFELLEKAELDAEVFAHYQALRRKADLKFEEAIDHLQLIEEEFSTASVLRSTLRDSGFDSRV